MNAAQHVTDCTKSPDILYNSFAAQHIRTALKFRIIVLRREYNVSYKRLLLNVLV